jgi:1-acyl-sn-glycerol-3-phosphate acyltransferase
LSRLLGRSLLAAGGWRIEGEFPDRSKLVVIVAPHTSNWDFVLGIAAVFALGLHVRFLGKHTLFHPPLGWLMRWFGGTPVVRESPQGAVAQAVTMIESEPAVVLGIAPAGTRTRGKPWRSGFYHIAHAARAPILPVAFDGAIRAIRLFPPFETSGDYEGDLPRLMALYDGIRGVRS